MWYLVSFPFSVQLLSYKYVFPMAFLVTVTFFSLYDVLMLFRSNIDFFFLFWNRKLMEDSPRKLHSVCLNQSCLFYVLSGNHINPFPPEIQNHTRRSRLIIWPMVSFCTKVCFKISLSWFTNNL